jgi:hypothetical protein
MPSMERIMANRGAAFERINFKQLKQQSISARMEFLQANWDSLLRAVLLTVVGAALVAVLVPDDWFARRHMLEATVQLERLAKKLESAKVIAPETASEVSRLMQQPRFDCRQTACEAALEERNHAVRSRLKTLLDRRAPTGVMKAGGDESPDAPAFVER